MEYEEAIKARVSKEEARREIERHDCDGGFDQFIADVGDKETYSGKEVLEWLGY